MGLTLLHTTSLCAVVPVLPVFLPLPLPVCPPVPAAYLVLRGIKTLALRVERQSANAAALAVALEQHPLVRAAVGSSYIGQGGAAFHAVAVTAAG